MNGGSDSRDVEPAWHERTSTLLGASIAALLGLGILFFGVSCVSREFNAPPPASQYFVEPSTSGSVRSTSGSATSSETITSTSPPVTTDINPGDPALTSTETSTSESSSSTPRTGRSTANDDDDDETSTTRRPRFNETRTPFPRP